MKVFLSGECRAENIWQLLDPTMLSESDFEIEAIKALSCVFKDYHCVKFRGNFLFEGVERIADLALVHRDFSHWFVVEVELQHHSLEQHVLPQVRCFRFGDPQDACVQSLCSAFENLSYSKARDLIQNAPKAVAVVANRYDEKWAVSLRALEIQYLVISLFGHPDGRTAYEVEGGLQIAARSLGYGTFSAIHECFITPLNMELPRGLVQLEDPFGMTSNWIVRETSDALWVSRERGAAGLPHQQSLQVLRTYTGKLSLRVPNFSGTEYGFTG